jgi:hypothetical protein
VSLASTVDPHTLGQGYLFRVRGLGSLLRPGAATTSYLQVPGKPTSGMVIPESALLRSAGGIWVYSQIADDRFTCVEIDPERST